jgi:hypothetical protein
LLDGLSDWALSYKAEHDVQVVHSEMLDCLLHRSQDLFSLSGQFQSAVDGTEYPWHMGGIRLLVEATRWVAFSIHKHFPGSEPMVHPGTESHSRFIRKVVDDLTAAATTLGVGLWFHGCTTTEQGCFPEKSYWVCTYQHPDGL